MNSVVNRGFASTASILLKCLEQADPMDIVHPDQTPEYPDVVRETVALLSDVHADLGRVSQSGSSASYSKRSLAASANHPRKVESPTRSASSPGIRFAFAEDRRPGTVRTRWWRTVSRPPCSLGVDSDQRKQPSSSQR